MQKVFAICSTGLAVVQGSAAGTWATGKQFGNWTEIWNEKAQRHYYWNTQTQETRWTKPEDVAPTNNVAETVKQIVAQSVAGKQTVAGRQTVAQTSKAAPWQQELAKKNAAKKKEPACIALARENATANKAAPWQKEVATKKTATFQQPAVQATTSAPPKPVKQAARTLKRQDSECDSDDTPNNEPDATGKWAVDTMQESSKPLQRIDPDFGFEQKRKARKSVFGNENPLATVGLQEVELYKQENETLKNELEAMKHQLAVLRNKTNAQAEQAAETNAIDMAAVFIQYMAELAQDKEAKKLLDELSEEGQIAVARMAKMKVPFNAVKREAEKFTKMFNGKGKGPVNLLAGIQNKPQLKKTCNRTSASSSSARPANPMLAGIQNPPQLKSTGGPAPAVAGGNPMLAGIANGRAGLKSSNNRPVTQRAPEPAPVTLNSQIANALKKERKASMTIDERMAKKKQEELRTKQNQQGLNYFGSKPETRTSGRAKKTLGHAHNKSAPNLTAAALKSIDLTEELKELDALCAKNGSVEVSALVLKKFFEKMQPLAEVNHPMKPQVAEMQSSFKEFARQAMPKKENDNN